MHPIRLILAAVLVVSLTACRSSQPPAAPAPTENSITLKDQQLLEIIEAEQALDSRAAESDAEFTEIQRIFRQVDQMYTSFFSRNPDDLNSRLLYGKLLLRYNDLEGARAQFLIAAKLAERADQQIAVIHQQLSTISAQQGDHALALVFADNAVKLEPDVAAYQYGLGQILMTFRKNLLHDEVLQEDEIERMISQSFSAAIDLEPDSLPQLYLDGTAFYEIDEPDWESARILWQTLANHPDTSTSQLDAIRMHQVRCLIHLDQKDQARSIAQDIRNPELKQAAVLLF